VPKRKEKVSPLLSRWVQTRNQNWFDHAENLNTAALDKFIVERIDCNHPFNETKINRLGAV